MIPSGKRLCDLEEKILDRAMESVYNLILTIEQPYQERWRDRPYETRQPALAAMRAQGANSGGMYRKMRVLTTMMRSADAERIFFDQRLFQTNQTEKG